MHIQSVLTGNSKNGVMYNNSKAVGSQIYPRGLGKYYDLYSYNGFIAFFFDYLAAILEIPFFLFGFGLFQSLILKLSWDNFFSVIFLYINP